MDKEFEEFCKEYLEDYKKWLDFDKQNPLFPGPVDTCYVCSCGDPKCEFDKGIPNANNRIVGIEDPDTDGPKVSDYELHAGLDTFLYDEYDNNSLTGSDNNASKENVKEKEETLEEKRDRLRSYL